MTRTPFILRNPSVPVVLAGLAVFTLAVTLLSQAYGTGAVPTSMVKVLGKTLCLALAAVAMDLVWGYLGILSLGQMAFFALGGYMIGQWLMYARTEGIVLTQLQQSPIPPPRPRSRPPSPTRSSAWWAARTCPGPGGWPIR